MRIRQRPHAGAEPDVFRAFRRDGDDNLGRGDRLDTAGIMFADPCFVEAESVAHGNDLEVAVEQQRRVFGKRMLRRHEHAEADVGCGHFWIRPVHYFDNCPIVCQVFGQIL